jgi:type I restriction enzyme S subunit
MAITTYCVDVNYIVSFIKSKVDELKAASKGLIPGIERNDVLNLPFPLPPLPEQHRIVAKIDAIFSLLDTIDALQSAYTANQKALRAKLIDVAIRGQLTEQLPEDATAEELYRQIQQEKAALEKAGKIKKSKPLAPIDEEEKPFDIPESWKWIRLGEIISIESGKNLTSAQMIEGTIPVFGGNGINGYHNQSLVHKETIVIGRVGFYCGSVHLTPQEAWVTDNAFITTYPEKSINRAYLVHALRWMNLGKRNNGSAQPVVSGKKIYPLPFPLPPLAEQKRIVAKLEELLPLCEG